MAKLAVVDKDGAAAKARKPSVSKSFAAVMILLKAGYSVEEAEKVNNLLREAGIF